MSAISGTVNKHTPFKLDLPLRLEKISEKDKLLAQLLSPPMNDYTSIMLWQALFEYNSTCKPTGQDPREVIKGIIDRTIPISPDTNGMINMADQGIIAQTSKQFEEIEKMNCRLWIKYKLEKLQSALNPNFVENNVIEKGRYKMNPIKESLNKIQSISPEYVKIFQEIQKHDNFDSITILKLPELESCKCQNQIKDKL